MSNIIYEKQKQISDMYLQMSLLEEVSEQFSDKKKSLSKYKSYVKKIPKLIRRNGLILTLSFLNKKSGGKNSLGSYTKSEIDSDKALYSHIIEVYLEFFKKAYSTKNEIKEFFDYFLGIDKELISKIGEKRELQIELKILEKEVENINKEINRLKKEKKSQKLKEQERKNKSNEIKNIENHIKTIILDIEKKFSEKLGKIKKNEKELKSLTLKSINFFDTYIIIVDGFVSDEYDDE